MRAFAILLAAALTATLAAHTAHATRGPLVVGFADDAAKYWSATAKAASVDPPTTTDPAPGDPPPTDPSTSDSTTGGESAGGVRSAAEAPKSKPAKVTYWDEFHATGATSDRMTVLWDAARPLEIPERGFLDDAVAGATGRGVDVVFSVRALRAGALTASPGRAALFASFLSRLAKAYPQVRTYVVGNEPNQPRFWQPQFQGKRAVAAAAYERVLAQAYDALKRVDPKIRVVAAGLSSRGNDNPSAANNRSTSPVRFIHDLGVAYRKSKRTRPIMDALGFHPYPRSSKDPLSRGLQWPNAGFTNLDRVKQALWDAFAGTRQPTVESGLKIVIAEIGWQVAVDQSARSPYTGVETSPVTSERKQASIYGDLIRMASCDPAVSDIYLFPLVDEVDLDRFQSGLIRADGTRRPSFAAVKRAVASTRAGCRGRTTAWRHAVGIPGVGADFGTTSGRPARQTAWGFRLATREEVRYRASVVRVAAPAGPRVMTVASSLGRPVLVRSGIAPPNLKPVIRFERTTLPAGSYVYAVRVSATMNPTRTKTFVSAPFAVEAARR